MPINITLEDLVLAYRKAKADAFYEYGNLNLIKFAEFEENLEENLSRLHDKLVNWDNLDHEDFVGTFTLVMKECFEDVKDKSFVFFSDNQRNWENVENVAVDFRIIGQHPVEFHILSSLWIDKVGLYLDDKINIPNSYGCRLNPIDHDDLIEWKQKETRLVGHFRPYFHDYQRWQYNGINAIENALSDGKKVVAITADVKKFYHRIDANFLLSRPFQDYFEFRLSPERLELTRILCEAIKTWNELIINNDNVPDEYKHRDLAGVPLGLGASKVIANLLLSFWDRQVMNEILPVYYGRYVDDIFLVIEDNGKITSSEDFWSFIAKRIEYLNVNPDSATGPVLEVPYGRHSYIEFGKGKEKLFLLESSSGASFIEALKDSLEENSSEWKMLPDTEDDLESFTKDMAQPSYNLQEIANGLRKADGISIQRLKFALQLRNFESLVNLLPKPLWINGLNSFFSIAKNYIVSPAKIGTFARYFPRLAKIAIMADEPQLALDIISEIENSWDSLNAKIPRDKRRYSRLAKHFNDELVQEAICSAINPAKRYSDPKWKELFNKINLNASEIKTLAQLLFLSDLHGIPYRKVFFDDNLGKKFWTRLDVNSSSLMRIGERGPHLKKTNIKGISELITTLIGEHRSDERVVPKALYFYTRPFSLLELTFLFPGWAESTESIKILRRFQSLFNIPPVEVQTEPYSRSVPPDQDLPLVAVDIPAHFKGINRTMALTSFKTSNDSWIAWVREDGVEPDHERFSRLFKLINDVISLERPNIQYLVFPELSVPRDLLLFIAAKLKARNISLIAGAEYERRPPLRGYPPDIKGIVSNQLIYILSTTTGVFTEQVMIIQEKTIPAIHEERELYDTGGKVLVASNENKYLINHAGFIFSGLICNDILNVDNRSLLRGQIDALIVIEWNKDIETYDSIIASTSNDLHCFVVQVNNRLYGDTRLRAPYKEAYRRDMVRVRGGELDYFVVCSVDAEALREFQRFHRSPEQPFKPVPTGFKMSDRRRQK